MSLVFPHPTKLRRLGYQQRSPSRAAPGLPPRAPPYMQVTWLEDPEEKTSFSPHPQATGIPVVRI